MCQSSKARFKRRATAAPNSIHRIKFDFSTAVAPRLKPSRAMLYHAMLHGSSSTWFQMWRYRRAELNS